MKQIVSFSGGIGSFCVLKRVLPRYSPTDVIIVFMDTLFEDEDLYRFNNDVFAYVRKNYPQVEIHILCDGRTPIDVSFQNHVVLNNRFPTCSKVLKSSLFRHWLKENGMGQNDAVVHIGIDAGETRRCPAITANYKHTVRYLLVEEGISDKSAMLAELSEWHIEIPRLYQLGFDHNNCGGRCFRGGIKHFERLREVMPERFYEFMEIERHLADNARQWHGTDNNYAILKRRKEPYTLSQLEYDCS